MNQLNNCLHNLQMETMFYSDVKLYINEVTTQTITFLYKSTNNWFKCIQIMFYSESNESFTNMQNPNEFIGRFGHNGVE